MVIGNGPTPASTAVYTNEKGTSSVVSITWSPSSCLLFACLSVWLAVSLFHEALTGRVHRRCRDHQQVGPDLHGPVAVGDLVLHRDDHRFLEHF